MTAILAFLRVFWLPLTLIVVGLAVLVALHHYGDVRYRSGRADEKAIWMPRQIAAEKALAVANERARTLEHAAESITANVEAEHATTIADLNARAANADSRFRALSVRLAANAARCRDVSPVPGAAPEPDGATAGRARAERIGSALGQLAKRCESDATGLADLQRWASQQAALRGTSPPTNR